MKTDTTEDTGGRRNPHHCHYPNRRNSW